MSKKEVQNKVAQRLITSTKVETSGGRITASSFDHESFSIKNRQEIIQILNTMASRIQSLVRHYFSRHPVKKRSKGRRVVKNSKALSPRSSHPKKKKKEKKKQTSSKSPTSRKKHQRNYDSKYEKQDQEHDDRVRRALFSTEEDSSLDHQYDYDLGEDGVGPIFEYSPTPQGIPRSTASSARTRTAPHANQQQQHQQKRVRTAEQEQNVQRKKDQLIEAYFPPVDKSRYHQQQRDVDDNFITRQKLMREIQSIKREMSAALESFHEEVETVKNSIIMDHSPDQNQNKNHEQDHDRGEKVHQGGLLEEHSFYSGQQDLEPSRKSSLLDEIKNQSSLIRASVDEMRSSLMGAQEEILHLRGLTNKSIQENDMMSEESPEQDPFQDVQYEEHHDIAAGVIQFHQRKRIERQAEKLKMKNMIDNIKYGDSKTVGQHAHEAMVLALFKGNVDLATIIMRRIFEMYQDKKKVSGFSLSDERHLVLLCQVVFAFISVEEVAQYGIQIFSLLSLLKGVQNCHFVFGKIGICDIIMTVLKRHFRDKTLCFQALMLAIKVLDQDEQQDMEYSKHNNSFLLTKKEYNALYSSLLNQNYDSIEEKQVIERTIKLLLKLTNDQEVVKRLEYEGVHHLVDAIVKGMCHHLRTEMFATYCKTVVNMCHQHIKDNALKEAFSARRYSHQYVTCMVSYKDNVKMFKLVANMIILIIGDASIEQNHAGPSRDDDLFDGIITEYFLSSLISVLKDFDGSAEDVVETVVVILHKISSNSHVVEALLSQEVDKTFRAISRKCANKTSLLVSKITLLLTILDKSRSRLSTAKSITPSTASSRRPLTVSIKRNPFLPKKNILLDVHDCYKIDELFYFLKMSINEGRDSIALQTLISITNLVIDKGNNQELAASLVDNLHPVVDVLNAFSASRELQEVGVNLIIILKIDYGGQLTYGDIVNFVKSLNLIIWGQFTAVSICEKYLDFLILCTNDENDDSKDVQVYAAALETFAAIKNIMYYHIGNRSIIIKCCKLSSQLAINDTVKKIIIAAGINDSVVEYMFSLQQDYDEETAISFQNLVLSLCSSNNDDQMSYFASQECSSLYLHILQTSPRSHLIWGHILKIILFVAEKKNPKYHIGLSNVNFAGVISRSLHTFSPKEASTQELVECILVFLMGVMTNTPSLERRFINVDTSNFVAALNQPDVQRLSICSMLTMDAVKILIRLIKVSTVVDTVKNLSLHYIELDREARMMRDVASKVLRRSLSRLFAEKLMRRTIRHQEESISESYDADFIMKCLTTSMERGVCSLAEATLERIGDIMDQYEEEYHFNSQYPTHRAEFAILTMLSFAPGIILRLALTFLSIPPIQYLSFRTIQTLPYHHNGTETTASSDLRSNIETIFYSLLRHMDDRVLCQEGIDCLIFLTALSEVNIFNASIPLGYQVAAYLLREQSHDVVVVNKVCQFVANMCKNMTNQVAYGELKITLLVYQHLISNINANDCIKCATLAISALCSDGHLDNLRDVANYSCLRTYYSILRNNPRNVEVHLAVSKMLISFTSGPRRGVMKTDFLKSGVSKELHDLSRTLLKSRHQGVAACVLALVVHLLDQEPYLRKPFVDAGGNFTLLEYTKQESHHIIKSMAIAGLDVLGEYRHKGKIMMIMMMINKKGAVMEKNYFKNINRIRSEPSLKVGIKSTLSRSNTLKRRSYHSGNEHFIGDSMSLLQKGFSSSLELEGSMFSATQSHFELDNAATVISRAVRSFLSRKELASRRREEEKRLPILKQAAEITNDPEVLLEGLIHCTKWGRVDLALVVTRRLLMLKKSDSIQHQGMFQLFERLTKEPYLLVDVLTTFTSMQVVQKQVLLLLQRLPFDEKEFEVMLQMRTVDTVMAISLRHPSSTDVVAECIKTLTIFSRLNSSWGSMLCQEERHMRILIHFLEKYLESDVVFNHLMELIISIVRNSTDNQSKFGTTKLSQYVLNRGEGNEQDIDRVSILCEAICALCEGGDLSNMEQYFTNDFLTFYHSVILNNIGNKEVIRQVYGLLMMASRSAGPYANFFARELATSDAAEFLVKVMMPEEQHRVGQSSFFLILIICCTYLRVAPSLIPIVLQNNLSSILSKYADAYWNEDVRKSAKYCLRVLNSYAKANNFEHYQDDLPFDESALDSSTVSGGGGGSFLLGSLAFDDSISVLTNDVSDFKHQHAHQHMDTPSNDNQESLYTIESQEVEDGKKLMDKLKSPDNNLQQSFALLRHALKMYKRDATKNGESQSSPIHLVLAQIIDIVHNTDMASYMQQSFYMSNEKQHLDGKQLVCVFYPTILMRTMKEFITDTDIQISCCKAFQRFPCDLISQHDVNIGLLMTTAIRNNMSDVRFCTDIMKYIVHMTAETDIVKKELTEESSLDAILLMLKQHKEDAPLVKLCLGYIFNICGQVSDDRTRTRLGETGVGKVLTEVLLSNKKNRDVISLVSKAIVSLCMNNNRDNLLAFGSLHNLKVYFSVIKTNPQDAKICSSMSFVILGMMSFGRVILIDALRENMKAFTFECKLVLEMTNFSNEAAEIVVMMICKIIKNFHDLFDSFVEVKIIDDLKLFAVGNWNEQTRDAAFKAIQHLENGLDESKINAEASKSDQAALQSNVQQTCEKDPDDEILHSQSTPSDINKLIDQNEVSDYNDENDSAQVEIVQLNEPKILQDDHECSEVVVGNSTYKFSPEEARIRIFSFLVKRIHKRSRAHTAWLQDVDVNDERVPIHGLLESVTTKARIHLAVSVTKKILISVQGNAKSIAMTNDLAAHPESLINFIYSFMSIETIPRDGLVILRSLTYSDEVMESMGHLGICELTYAIIRRYIKNLNVCVSSFKTLAFFAKGSLSNRRVMTQDLFVRIMISMESNKNAVAFMLEAYAAMTELCRDCDENKSIVAFTPLNKMAMETLVKFKLDKECIRTVGAMIKVLCLDSQQGIIKKFASRECLSVMFEILSDYIENDEICKLYCSIFTLMIGPDTNYYLVELTASNACKVLDGVLKSESAFRHNTSILTPIFTLLVHYVYNIPLFTLELYKTSIPVTLDIFRQDAAWSESKKAADIISSKIKMDIKQVEVNRKRTMRLAKKQKSQQNKHRPTSLPKSGISDWSDLADLFKLLKEALAINNDDDVLQICQRISALSRTFDDRTRKNYELVAASRSEYIPLLFKVLRAFTKEKSIMLLALSVTQSLPFKNVTPDIANFGEVFTEILQAHENDSEMCERLLTSFNYFIDESLFVRQQMTTEQSLLFFFNFFKKNANNGLEILELCVSYISKICNDEINKREFQTKFGESGLCSLVIKLLIDVMDDQDFVGQYVQLILVLVSDGHQNNLRIFASGTSLKLYIHITKSSPDNFSISSSMYILLTSILSALSLQAKSEVVQDVCNSSFVADLCALIDDQNVPKSPFHENVIANNLSLVSYVVCELEFLRQAVANSNMLEVLQKYIDEGSAVEIDEDDEKAVEKAIRVLTSHVNDLQN